jgi:acyl carrier protein
MAQQEGKMADSIEQRARRMVREHLGVDDDKITADSNFADDLGADSLDSVEMCMTTEEEFGVEMDDSASDKIFGSGTFGDLIEWLNAKVAAA